MNRREIPALTANVDAPTLLLLGTLTNEHGQVISRSFVAIANRHGFVAGDALPDVVAWLEAHGFDSKARNAGDTELPDDIKDFIAQAVETARGTLSPMVYTQAQIAQTRITEWQQRAQDWRDNRATVHGTRKLTDRHAYRRRGEARTLARSIARHPHPSAPAAHAGAGHKRHPHGGLNHDHF